MKKTKKINKRNLKSLMYIQIYSQTYKDKHIYFSCSS